MTLKTLKCERSKLRWLFKLGHSYFHPFLLSVISVYSELGEKTGKHLFPVMVEVGDQTHLSVFTEGVCLFEDTEETCEHGFLEVEVGLLPLSALVALVANVRAQQL